MLRILHTTVMHPGEFSTVDVHTIYTRSGVFNVNGFWDTNTIIPRAGDVVMINVGLAQAHPSKIA